MHIFQNESRGRAQRIVDQRGVLRDIRHFLASFVELDIRVTVMRDQARLRLGVAYHLLAEGGGDAFGGDVVMRRADTTAGEHKIMRRGQQFDCLDDGLSDIGNDTRLAKLDALLVQLFGEPANVFVLGAPAEDFITDHKDRGGRIGHGFSPA